MTEVRLRKGWLYKDHTGFHWTSSKPNWDRKSLEWIVDEQSTNKVYIGGLFFDPWPEWPEGGPTCLTQTSPKK